MPAADPDQLAAPQPAPDYNAPISDAPQGFHYPDPRLNAESGSPIPNYAPGGANKGENLPNALSDASQALAAALGRPDLTEHFALLGQVLRHLQMMRNEPLQNLMNVIGKEA